MTYYEQLVKRAATAMNRYPRSIIAMDAESFSVVSKSSNAAKVALATRKALKQGRTPVIIQKPRRSETWVL